MFALSGEGVLEECYTEAGFRDVEIRSVSVERYFPSTAEAIRAMKDSFPRLQALLKRLNESDCEITWSEIRGATEPIRGAERLYRSRRMACRSRDKVSGVRNKLHASTKIIVAFMNRST